MDVPEETTSGRITPSYSWGQIYRHPFFIFECEIHFEACLPPENVADDSDPAACSERILLAQRPRTGSCHHKACLRTGKAGERSQTWLSPSCRWVKKKKQSDTRVAVALHVISLLRLCVGLKKTQDGPMGHQRKSWLLKKEQSRPTKTLVAWAHSRFFLGYFSAFLWKIDWMGWCQPVTTTMAALCNGDCADISIIGGMPGCWFGLRHNIG